DRGDRHLLSRPARSVRAPPSRQPHHLGIGERGPRRVPGAHAMIALGQHRRVDLHDDRGSVTVWAISATVACVLIIGLVIDGGTMLRARSDAFALASSAARAGAQELDSAAAVQGLTVLDPVAAERA